MKNEFVIRTKKPAQYFRGKIMNGYFPIVGANKFYVSCLSYAGGNRNDSPLRAINLQTDTKTELIRKLKSIAKKGKYIFSFNPNNF